MRLIRLMAGLVLALAVLRGGVALWGSTRAVAAKPYGILIPGPPRPPRVCRPDALPSGQQRDGSVAPDVRGRGQVRNRQERVGRGFITPARRGLAPKSIFACIERMYSYSFLVFWLSLLSFPPGVALCSVAAVECKFM